MGSEARGERGGGGRTDQRERGGAEEHVANVERGVNRTVRLQPSITARVPQMAAKAAGAALVWRMVAAEFRTRLSGGTLEGVVAV